MTRYPVETFELVSGDLTREHFERNPLWSEYYDFEERDEIAGWGVSRAWLDSELERLPSHPHPCYPVLVHEPIPARMRLFFQASFRTPNGHDLSGYLVNLPPLAVHIFLPGGDETLGRNPVRELDERTIARLQSHIGDPGDPILPLAYQSRVLGEDGRPIRGVFAGPAAS